MKRLLRFRALGLGRLDHGDYAQLRPGAITAPQSESTLHALGWLYLGSATFGVTLNLVAHSTLAAGIRWTLLGVAYALGALLLTGRRRLPEEAVDIALTIGATLVTVSLILKGADGTRSFPVFYIWAALAAAFLLPRRRALLQLGIVAAFDAVFLLNADVGMRVSLRQWLMTVGTAAPAPRLV